MVDGDRPKLVTVRFQGQYYLQVTAPRLLRIGQDTLVSLPIDIDALVGAEGHPVELEPHAIAPVTGNGQVRVGLNTPLAVFQSGILKVGGEAHRRALVEDVLSWGLVLDRRRNGMVRLRHLAAGDGKQRE